MLSELSVRNDSSSLVIPGALCDSKCMVQYKIMLKMCLLALLGASVLSTLIMQHTLLLLEKDSYHYGIWSSFET